MLQSKEWLVRGSTNGDRRQCVISFPIKRPLSSVSPGQCAAKPDKDVRETTPETTEGSRTREMVVKKRRRGRPLKRLGMGELVITVPPVLRDGSNVPVVVSPGLDRESLPPRETVNPVVVSAVPVPVPVPGVRSEDYYNDSLPQRCSVCGLGFYRKAAREQHESLCEFLSISRKERNEREDAARERVPGVEVLFRALQALSSEVRSLRSEVQRMNHMKVRMVSDVAWLDARAHPSGDVNAWLSSVDASVDWMRGLRPMLPPETMGGGGSGLTLEMAMCRVLDASWAASPEVLPVLCFEARGSGGGVGSAVPRAVKVYEYYAPSAAAAVAEDDGAAAAAAVAKWHEGQSNWISEVLVPRVLSAFERVFFKWRMDNYAAIMDDDGFLSMSQTLTQKVMSGREDGPRRKLTARLRQWLLTRTREALFGECPPSQKT